MFSVKLDHFLQRYDGLVKWQHFVIGDAQRCLIQLLLLIRVVVVVVVTSTIIVVIGLTLLIVG